MIAQPKLVARLAFLVCLSAILSGCFVPDEFDLEVNALSADDVSWIYNGKWRFFFAGYDPRQAEIPPKELKSIGAELSKLPGGVSVTHIGKNVWQQSLGWTMQLRNSQNQPTVASFPSTELWMVRIIPESENSVLIVTTNPPPPHDLGDLIAMGYRSSGTITITTSGTIEQLSGPTLSKAWFRSSYYTKLDLFADTPLKVRVKW